MKHPTPNRRRLSALIATALLATSITTGALPALAAPGITVTPTSGLETTEAAGTATFTVVLDELPTATVEIPISSSDTGEATVDKATLTFTVDDWNVAQTVTVTGVDDDITDGDTAFTIVTGTANSADANYDVIDPDDVTGTNLDNEVAGITVNPGAGLATTEGATTDTFTVVLDEKPTANVTVTVASSDAGEATASPELLTFTDLNWNEAQTVTVTGVDDDVADGSQNFTISLTASATGGYTGVTEEATGANADDDSASTIVTKPGAGLVTTEAGGTDTFAVRLGSEPTHDVVVTLTSSDTSEATIAPSTLTFLAGNWSTPQTVTVTGVDDDLVDGDIAYTISGALDSADPKYDVLTTADVDGVNSDNDVASPPAPAPEDEETEAFGDISTFDTETTSAIARLVELGITEGTSATTFSPNQVVSRWQMALFLTRQLGVHEVELPTATDQGFTDLTGFDAETQNAIDQLAMLGVTSGTGADTYSPAAGVSRWQMALFMTRVLTAAGVELPTGDTQNFNDTSELSVEAQLAIRQLAALGVAMGVGDGMFDPAAEVSRWQMALFIVRTLEAAGIPATS